MNAKKRYTAMQRYFKYHMPPRECLKKPCPIKFEDKDYICFTNTWSLVLTTESCGDIELYDGSFGKYPDVIRLIRWDGIKKKIDFNEVISEARSKGYRLSKKEVEHDFKYLMLYDDMYYKIGLIDATYRIIDDGGVAMTYHPYGERMPLIIHNKLGICIIMPVKYYNDTGPDEDKVVIKIE